jgi:tRNA1Val (adenine37-N6)-methyltransferase
LEARRSGECHSKISSNGFVLTVRKPFFFKQFEIQQTRAAMPVTTDACVFGALCNFNHPMWVLDIGAGTGLLSLMLAQKFPNAKFTALEPHEGSFLDAQINIANSGWKERIKVEQCKIEAWKPDNLYDAIICNPPFFHGQLPSENRDKRSARHGIDLTFEVLIGQIKAMLNPQGTASILLPVIHEEYMRNICHGMGLYIAKTTAIRPSLAKPAHLVIMDLVHENKAEEYAEFITFGSHNTYSEMARILLEPYYLSL